MGLSPKDLSERLGEVQLVDVREPYEWEAGRIPGALHIEFAQLSERAAEVDKERPVVFYCRVGNRSAVAMEAFAGAGYQAENLEGGLVAWNEAGLPLDPADGEVAAH